MGLIIRIAKDRLFDQRGLADVADHVLPPVQANIVKKQYGAHG
jgi:hypothetical protein